MGLELTLLALLQAYLFAAHGDAVNVIHLASGQRQETLAGVRAKRRFAALRSRAWPAQLTPHFAHACRIQSP
jgi:hypothetical protein